MYSKPIPEADIETAPFWDGCRDHRLMLMRCAKCKSFRYPPTPFCAACQSGEAEWVEATGKGTVFSWIVVRHPVPRESFGDVTPFVVALVELEEGVRMASNIVGCEPEAVRGGMPLEVVFDDVTDEVTLPKFKPAGT